MGKKVFKLLLLLVASAMVVVMLVGCQNKSSQGGSSEGGSSPKAQKVTINTINIFGTNTNPDYSLKQDVLKAVLKAYPNASINDKEVSSGDYENTVFKTMVASNTLPELFPMMNSSIPALADRNMCITWDDILAQDPEWKDSFLDIWGEATYKGKIYGIPYLFLVNQCLLYNKDMLSSVGYDSMPLYWDDFLILCQKLKNAGKIPIALGDKDGWPVPSHFVEILCEYVCGPDWVKGIAQDSPDYNFSDPCFITVMQMIEDLVKKGYLNRDIASIDHNTEDVTYLFKEQAAILPCGPWMFAGIARDCPPDVLKKLAVAPFPAPKDSKAVVKSGLFTGGSGWEYAISSKATDAQKAICIDIVKRLTSPTFVAGEAQLGALPVLKAQYVAPYDKSKVPAITTQLIDLISKCPTFPPMNQQRIEPTVSDAFYKNCQELVAGIITGEQAALNIQAVYEKARAAAHSK